MVLCAALTLWICLFPVNHAAAGSVGPEELRLRIEPPYQLGEQIDGTGIWKLANLDGKHAGFVFETEPLAPIPGFSGRPINLLVSLNTEGRLLEVELLDHSEPVFLSGLGEAPFHRFVEQYKGLSIYDPMSVGVPYGKVEGVSTQVYLDGVAKATASVRIAHEAILAAAFAVAREKMQGLGHRPAPVPDPGLDLELSFQDLVEQGIATHHVVTNAEVQARFVDTEWESDDPAAGADPQAPYLDLWIIDIGPPAIARAVLTEEGFAELQRFLELSPENAPILLIDTGRHGLVSQDFVRNTEPDLMAAKQDGLPIQLRDADLDLALKPWVPWGHQLVVRSDRRLGFDPTRPWDLILKVNRRHGSFMPTIGSIDLVVRHSTPDRFYLRPTLEQPHSTLETTFRQRATDLGLLLGFLVFLVGILLRGMAWFSRRRQFRRYRFAILALVIGFVGWWGQGQLSIVTPLGTLQAGLSGQGLGFLLYDPFSLLIWLFVLASLLVWGRGFFCGWLCPYGAMQEFSALVGEKLKLPQVRISGSLDRTLRLVKYIVLLILLGLAVAAPSWMDAAVEVEPFKTALTTAFQRDWPYVAYALFWLLLGVFLFKAFCRYVCPLGAALAMGGLLRRLDWIPRRKECGAPCRLCAVRCRYRCIDRSGTVDYAECFQCLDCVTIYHDADTCAPLVVRQRREKQES